MRRGRSRESRKDGGAGTARHAYAFHRTAFTIFLASFFLFLVGAFPTRLSQVSESFASGYQEAVEM
jgi:hypothetical protein